MTLEERNGCPLCYSQQAHTFIPFPDIPVVQCIDCGFIYSQRTFSGQALESYYEDGFGSQRHLQGQVVNSMVNSSVLKRLVNIQDIANVLDVGTGYGFLLKELHRQEDLGVTGVELSRQEATYAKSTLGLNVINAFLSDSGLPKEHYDLVTSFEVIEHIPYPASFIQEMVEYAKLGGYLLIMTDNFESYMAKSLGAGFPKWIPHSHISHFSTATLKRAIEDTNKLEILKIVSYTPWEIWLRYLYYKIRGISKSPSDSFDLVSTLETEMKGGYKLFSLRKTVNKMWAKITLSDKMDGALIYFLCKRIA